MLTQIVYVRQQIAAAQRASTPSARADHLQRALDGLARVEWQAVDILADPPADPFLPADPYDINSVWTVDEILAREG